MCTGLFNHKFIDVGMNDSHMEKKEIDSLLTLPTTHYNKLKRDRVINISGNPWKADTVFLRLDELFLLHI